MTKVTTIEARKAGAAATAPFRLLDWTTLAPLVGWALLAISLHRPPLPILQGTMLIACVLASVHHAEVIARRVGEPFGTLLLALAVTVIEVGLIVSLMLGGGEGAATLARDTVFASVMILLNGMVGLCLVVAALRHGEQSFNLAGVNATLTVLAALTAMSFVLPNAAGSLAGPGYTTGQLVFVAVASLVLYLGFVLVQAVRRRDYFQPPAGAHREAVHEPPARRQVIASAVLLPLCLAAVVLLSKALAPAIEGAVAGAGLPRAVVGVVVAAIVLLPEGFSALRAARAGRLQTSLNLALGSAMASIGLTIPAVTAVSLITGGTLTLGLDLEGSMLLGLSLMLASFSLGTGRTIGLQGLVHLAIFGFYLTTVLVA